MITEYHYRMRNTTKNIYEYIWLVSTDPEPTILPDNPQDNCNEELTAIINHRIV